MNIKIGDRVRFLNSVGGGRVIRIDGKVAYVEDSDGFEMPVLIKECVVVGNTDIKVKESVDALRDMQTENTPQKTAFSKADPTQKGVDAPLETVGGDILNVVLGFEPQSIKTLSVSDFDMYLVNDSNYYIYLTIAYRSTSEIQWMPLYNGLLEPNIQEFIGEFPQNRVNALDRLRIQLLAFKTNKSYTAKAPVNLEIKIDNTKFCKLHCFHPQRYFDIPTLAFPIVENDAVCVHYQPVAVDIERSMREKSSLDLPRRSKSSKPSKDPIIIDLHASELLDNTSGLSSADILNYQVETFRQALDKYRNSPGTKIIFIHGKGEGVLRQALMKELNHRYSGHDVQDASFAEYGFGATQVTIRTQNALNTKPHPCKKY